MTILLSNEEDLDHNSILMNISWIALHNNAVFCCVHLQNSVFCLFFSYFRRNFRGGRRGAGPGPMNRGGFRRMRPRNFQPGQGPPQAQGGAQPRQNGQEGDAPATTSSPPPPQQAKPKTNTKPTGTTIETTTNESQA